LLDIKKATRFQNSLTQYHFVRSEQKQLKITIEGKNNPYFPKRSKIVMLCTEVIIFYHFMA